jgi:ketosteroid isomerase-like protein
VSEPYEDIRNLLGTYCERIDSGDFASVAELFADGVLLDDKGAEIARGAAQCAALWTRIIRLYDGSPRTRHMVAAPVIELDGDTATCRSSYVVFQGLPNGRFEPICGGRYRDTFAWDSSGWHFTSRMFFLDQIGDLSHHLEGM